MTNKMIQYYNRNKVREDTKKKFKEWYQTYAEFMNVIDLPKYKLDFYYSKEHCTSSCTHPKNADGFHKINVNELLIPTHGDNARAIAYHEFTHIYDHHYLLQNMSEEDKNGILLAYTEYHATMVQMKTALSFKTEDENKNIAIQDIVYDGIKTKSVKDYIEYQTFDVKETIDDYFNKRDTENMINVVRHTIYYFAQADFFLKYCEDKKEILQHMDLHYFTEKFGMDIVTLHLYLQKIDVSKIDDFEKIFYLMCKIGSDYLNKE